MPLAQRNFQVLRHSRHELVRPFCGQWLIHAVICGPYLDLRLSVALWKDLLETSLENTDVVVNDGFLFGRDVLAHDAD